MSDGTDAFILLRHLANDTTDDVNDDMVNAPGDEGMVLRSTCKVYGSIFLGLFTVFCFLRQRYPLLYNVRSWAPELKCDLAMDQHGFIRWLWELYFVKDDVILDQCGMDALCFLRVLFFGVKLSCVGILNAMWLMPVYASAQYMDDSTSKLVRLSTSYVPSGSKRFIATVVAAYIIFGFTMYLILNEFKWYTGFRHKFLMKRTPRNYAVYVTGIPDEYRSSYALTDYFRQCFSRAGVLEAQVTMEIPDLERTVEKRRMVAQNLAHAVDLENIKGIKSIHRSVRLRSGKISTEDSITIYQTELDKLNKEVADGIRKVKFVNDRFLLAFERSHATRSGLSEETDESNLATNMSGASWQASRNLGLDTIDETESGVRRRLNSDMFDISGDSPPTRHRRRLSSDMFEKIGGMVRRRRLSSDMFDATGENVGTHGGLSVDLPDHETSTPIHANLQDGHARMNSDMFDLEACSPTDSKMASDDMDEDEANGYSVPPTMTKKQRSEMGIFQEDEQTDNTVPHSETSTPSSNGIDEADAFASFFFGADLTMQPRAPEADIASSPTNIETDQLECDDGEQLSDADGTSLVVDDDDRFDIPDDSSYSSGMSDGDGAHQHEVIPEPPDIRFPDGSPLQHQSSSKKSLRLQSVARLVPKDVTKVAKSVVKESTSFVQDRSTDVRKVIKEVNPENLKRAGDLGMKGIVKAKDAGVHQIMKAKDKGVANVKNLTGYVLGNGDGTPRDAGFVSFTKLSTTHAALQMVHHPLPFVMSVQPAPDPNDIYWKNVGMPHKARQVGRLISLFLTLLLCFFWTIPVTFISSLTEVESLRESVPFIDKMLEKAPWMQYVLEQLAPLLLLGLNACLPVLLREISKFEGHIASSALEASMFPKMAGFMVRTR